MPKLTETSSWRSAGATLAALFVKLVGRRLDLSVSRRAGDGGETGTEFDVAAAGGPLFGGWYRISYRNRPAERAALPVVTVDHGDGRQTEIPLGFFETAPLRWLGRIHGPIDKLTLRLRGCDGTHPVPEITLRRIGSIELILRAVTVRPDALGTVIAAALTFKRALLRRRLSEVFRPAFPDREEQYRIWRRIHERPSEPQDIAETAGGSARPFLSVLMSIDRPFGPHCRTAMDSVLGQGYPAFELVVAVPAAIETDFVAAVERQVPADGRLRVVASGNPSAGCVETALDAASGDFVMLFGEDDVLADDALFHLAQAVAEAPVASTMIYGDSDSIDADGHRFAPQFKPGPNRELLYAHDYIGRPCLFDVHAVRIAGGFDEISGGASDYRLKLRLMEAETAGSVRHVSKVLLHRRNGDRQWDDDDTDHRAAVLERHLDGTDPGCRVMRGPFATTRVVRPLPDPPPVSLIVPTRDQLDLTRRCIDGLVNGTDYDDLEILLVDNDSRDAATLAWFDAIAKHPKVSVIGRPGPFNYSAINNEAVARAAGTVIGLINNDIEIIDGGWLREMVSLAVRPEIGAVGAKLLYPDRRVQHAGIVVGVGGVAGHGHKSLAADAAGYGRRLQCTQFVSAVTGACLVVEKAKYLAGGGLDAENLAVAFNDVDFCLKLAARGFSNVYTPYATLIHHESASRGDDMHGDKAKRFEKEAAYMADKWRIGSDCDPYYSPHLSRRREDFSIEIGY